MTNIKLDSHINPGKFKMIICIRRKPGMSRETFQDYWLNHHGPLAASVQAAGLTPPMLGYVQNHTIDNDSMKAFRDLRGMAVEPYDGLTEVWLNDPLDLDMGSNISDEVIAANKMLIEDEAKFVDLEYSRVFIAREQTIFMSAPQGKFFKMIICDRGLPSLTRTQFQDYWLNKHAPLALSVRNRGYAPPMFAYLQNHTLDIPMLEPFKQARGMISEAYDGIAEIWLNEMEDLGKIDNSNPRQLAEKQRLLDDENQFVDFSRCSVFMTIPHRIF